MTDIPHAQLYEYFAAQQMGQDGAMATGVFMTVVALLLLFAAVMFFLDNAPRIDFAEAACTFVLVALAALPGWCAYDAFDMYLNYEDRQHESVQLQIQEVRHTNYEGGEG